MSIWATIFGSGRVIEKGMELIDEAWTTDEERIEARANAKIALMRAYAPFKIAQRYLAIMFAGVFLLCFMLVLGMTLAGIGNPDDVFKVIDEFMIDWAMTAILTFYFGGGLVDSAKRDNSKRGENHE